MVSLLLLQSASGLASLLIWILVFFLVLAGIWYLIVTLVPAELQRFAKAVFVVIALIVLIYFALQFGGGGFGLK